MENKVLKKVEKSAPKASQNKKKISKEAPASAVKVMDALSMSFYGDSTLKKRKQIILDECPLEDTLSPLHSKVHKSNSKNVTKRSSKKIKPEPKFSLPLGKER